LRNQVVGIDLCEKKSPLVKTVGDQTSSPGSLFFLFSPCFALSQFTSKQIMHIISSTINKTFSLLLHLSLTIVLLIASRKIQEATRHTTMTIETNDLAVALPPQKLTTSAKPPHRKKQHHFVFGYGSLICEKSRSITNPTLADKEALPVVIQDVERVWSARTKTGYTAMGVRFSKNTECTGVLIEVTEEELADLDKREANYDRRPIHLENIDQVPFLEEEDFYEDDHPVFEAKEGDDKHHNVRVWIYIQRDPIPADPSHPIPQSYVDIIIRGCLTISEEFARSVIDTTAGWTNKEDHWVDDREVPIYKRADLEYSNQHADTIDQLMKDQNPEAYEERVEYDPLDHLEALAEALEDDKAHPSSISHVVKQVKKEAARKEEEEANEQAEEITAEKQDNNK
jgi:hypothetical protein